MKKTYFWDNDEVYSSMGRIIGFAILTALNEGARSDEARDVYNAIGKMDTDEWQDVCKVAGKFLWDTTST